VKWVLNISTLHAEEGGPPTAVLSIAKDLALLGEDVHVVALRMPGKTLARQFSSVLSAGVSIHDIPVKRLGKFRFSIRQTLTVLAVSRGAAVVTAHGFYQFTCVLVWAISILRQAHFFIQPHGVFEPYQERHGSGYKRLFMRIIGNRILARAGSIFVASEMEAKGVVESTRARRDSIIVTGLGTVPQEQFSDGDRFSSRRVLFLSRIAEKKRLDLLIEACRLASLRSDDFSLDVCGTGDPGLLKRLMYQSQGLPITFHGHTEGDQRTRIESSCALFCLPSDNENFGQAITEAMAAGLPVITTKNAGASVHVELAAGGWILDCPSPEELTDTISRALADPIELRARARSAFDYAARELSWAAVAERWRTRVRELDAHTEAGFRHQDAVGY
jgi:glycosyltransferase involved in cell wall biosynthesis